MSVIGCVRGPIVNRATLILYAEATLIGGLLLFGYYSMVTSAIAGFFN